MGCVRGSCVYVYKVFNGSLTLIDAVWQCYFALIFSDCTEYL
jgi:hypothetical protein